MAGPYATSDSRNYVGIGKQSGRTVSTAPNLFAAYLPTVDFEHAQEINRILEAGAAGQVTFAEKIGHMPSGKFVVLGRPSITGKLSAYLLGADSVTGTGPWDHALTDDLVTDYLSVENNLADEAIERVVDCALGELVFQANVDNPVMRVTGTWVGGTPTWQASPTAETYETETPWVHFDASWTIDGGAKTNVRGLTLTVRRKLSLIKIADVVPVYIQKVGEEVELEIEQQALDINDAYREVHYGSSAGTAHTKTAQSGSLDVTYSYGAGAAQRSLRLQVPALDYSDAKYSPLNPDGEDVKITRPAVGRKGTGVLCTITAKTNDSPAYV